MSKRIKVRHDNPMDLLPCPEAISKHSQEAKKLLSVFEINCRKKKQLPSVANRSVQWNRRVSSYSTLFSRRINFMQQLNGDCCDFITLNLINLIEKLSN